MSFLVGFKPAVRQPDPPTRTALEAEIVYSFDRAELVIPKGFALLEFTIAGMPQMMLDGDHPGIFTMERTIPVRAVVTAGAVVRVVVGPEVQPVPSLQGQFYMVTWQTDGHRRRQSFVFPLGAHPRQTGRRRHCCCGGCP